MKLTEKQTAKGPMPVLSQGITLGGGPYFIGEGSTRVALGQTRWKQSGQQLARDSKLAEGQNNSSPMKPGKHELENICMNMSRQPWAGKQEQLAGPAHYAVKL